MLTTIVVAGGLHARSSREPRRKGDNRPAVQNEQGQAKDCALPPRGERPPNPSSMMIWICRDREIPDLRNLHDLDDLDDLVI